MTTFFPAGGSSYYLNSSISSTDTTVTLASFTTPVTGTPWTMAIFNSSIMYGTIGPKTSSSEFISFTGITQNLDGTATLTGVTRGLNKSYPYTSDVTFKVPHSGQSIFILSDVPQVFAQYPAKENAETIPGDWHITGQWTFDTFPITPSNSDASTTVKGVTKLSVAPILSTNPIAAGTNDPRIPVAYAVDASGSDAYAITPSSAITAYAAGQHFTFKAGTANTGAATLAVNGLSAIAIVKNGSTALATGDIVVNQVVEVVYDGTNMQMVSPLGYSSAISADVQTFTSSNTWTKPANAKSTFVIVIGGGGSGASGDVRAITTQNLVQGGGGGGGGATLTRSFDASLLSSTVAVTVGATVAGAVGVLNSGTTLIPGNDGTDGNLSSFGTLVIANGGKKGVKSSGGGGNGGFATGFGSSVASTSATAILGQGGAAVANSAGTSSENGGGSGGDGAETTGAVGYAGGSSIFGSGGGGGGGQAQTDGSSVTAGGAGGATGVYSVGGGGAGSAGNSSGASTAGTAGSRTNNSSSGGGGSGGSRATSGTITGGAGGDGGTPGGGGGGSGATGGVTGTTLTSGVGGAGARGEVIVITYF